MDWEERFYRLSRHEPGQFFIFRREWWWVLNCQTAVVLGEVLNIYCMLLSRSRVEDGWIAISNSFLRRRMPLSRRTIERHLQTLMKMDVLKLKSIGFPKRRMIRVSPFGLEKLSSMATNCPHYRGASSGDRNDASSGDRSVATIATPVSQLGEKLARSHSGQRIKKRANSETLNNKKKYKKKRCRSILEKEEEKEQKKVKLCKKLAEQLVEAVRSFRRVSNSTTKWWMEFRKLNKKVPMKDIRKVLDDYCEFLYSEGDQTTNGNPQRFHIAHSARAFREKFDALEADMHRMRVDQGLEYDYSNEKESEPEDEPPEEETVQLSEKELIDRIGW